MAKQDSEKLNRDAADRVAHKKAVSERKKSRDKNPYNINGTKKYDVMTRGEQIRLLHELKSRLLTHKHMDRYVSKLFGIAMDDDHDGQMAAMKILADRLLPTASFSTEGNKSSAIQINISGLQVSSVEKQSTEKAVPVSVQ
jgi:hypothetical protein